MAMIFKDMIDEVKRRATKDQGGTTFDNEIKNVINTSLFRLAREAAWRVLRRKKIAFDTKKAYTTGTGSGTFTSGSNHILMSGANLVTDAIEIGRRIKLQNESQHFTIETITSETSCNLDRDFGATTITGSGTYTILGKEEYNLPIQSGHRMFLWHEAFGFPYRMTFITDQDFYERGIINTTEAIPTHYRMWGEDMTINQMLTASNISVSSTNSGDTSLDVTVFGTVEGFPDFEKITTDSSDGTTEVTSTNIFSNVERVTKDATSSGRIIAAWHSGNNMANNVTVAVIPANDITSGILYKKIQLYPIPDSVFPMNIQYYKDPYRLVNDEDVHELGQEFDEALILLSTAKINYQTSKKEGDDFFKLYVDEVRNLRKTNADKIDWFPKLRRPHHSGFRDAFAHPNLLYKQAGSFFGPAHRRR